MALLHLPMVGNECLAVRDAARFVHCVDPISHLPLEKVLCTLDMICPSIRPSYQTGPDWTTHQLLSVRLPIWAGPDQIKLFVLV